MKRYIRTAQSIHTMSYKDVLNELKKCILRRDTRRMQELSISCWYDKAIAELRKSMGISACAYINRMYVRADSNQSQKVFDETSTGTSYYDNFLNEKDLKYMQDAKNLDGKIVMMTPDEYFKEAAKIFHSKYSPRQLEQQRSDSLLPQYVEDMKNGDVFPLCFLNYAHESQEGLHRMLAAKKAFGPDKKYPVLIITPYDIDAWNEAKLYEEMRDYERWDFEDLIKEMESDLSDWSSPMPADIADQAKEYLERRAKARGDDIQVDCEVHNYQGDFRLDITLTHYKGIELDYQSPSGKSPWLANMFDIDEGKSDEEIDELLDGLDDSDFEIEDFFFQK